jgi:hypothetical protein
MIQPGIFGISSNGVVLVLTVKDTLQHLNSSKTSATAIVRMNGGDAIYT